MKFLTCLRVTATEVSNKSGKTRDSEHILNIFILFRGKVLFMAFALFKIFLLIPTWFYSNLLFLRAEAQLLSLLYFLNAGVCLPYSFRSSLRT